MTQRDDVEQLDFFMLRREHPRSFFERYMLNPAAFIRSKGELFVYCYLWELPPELARQIVLELRQRFPRATRVDLVHLPSHGNRAALLTHLDRAYGRTEN